MRAPLILLIASALAAVAAISLPGWSDLLLIALPSAFASLYLLVKGWLLAPAKPKPTERAWPRASSQPSRATKAKTEWAIIDGSNVMHWKEGPPDLATVSEVLAGLKARGLSAGVVFDANAGYKLKGRYQDDPELAAKLNLPASQVLVVPKGTVADPIIVQTAADLGARIVTNDRYRDWATQFPQSATPGHLIRGGYANGRLWLDLG